MRIELRRTAAAAVAAGVTASVAAAVILVAPAAQAADRPRADVGFNARSLGAFVRTDDVDFRPVRLGFANTSCTRTLGRRTVATAADVPVGDLIDLTAVRSVNRTYRNGSKFGINAVTTIGRVDVGRAGGPRLSVTGLRAQANAASDAGRLSADQSFTFQGLDITGVPGGTGPLGDLLDAVTGGTNQVISLLEAQNQPITIPGLARISLGDEEPRIVRGRSAAAQVSGLRIQLLSGDLTDVTVGDAYARVGKGATAGVLGMSSQALEGSLVNDAIGIGATNRRTIGCEGTQGKLETFRRASSGLAAPLLVDIEGSVVRQRGSQRGAAGNGMTRHQINRVRIVPDQLSPLLPTVTIRGVDARVSVAGNFARKGSKRVQRSVDTSVGALVVDGRTVQLPRPGNTRSYDGGTVQVTREIVRQGFYGADATAIRVKFLPELVGPALEPVTLDFGVVDGDFLPG